ncbi:MAG: hypothetical protein ABIS14_00680 [Sphingomonas sp.]
MHKILLRSAPRGAVRRAITSCAALGIAVAAAPGAGAQTTAQSAGSTDVVVPVQGPEVGPPSPQTEAWWTGSMLSNSAATLPTGHVLAETYFFDVASAGSNSYGSFTYLLYGLADGVTVGATPGFGYNTARGQRISSGVGMSDLSLRAQFRLRSATPGTWKPAVAFAIGQAIPTGRYDRLGAFPGNGNGSGLPSTTLSLYTQSAFLASTGRPMRVRLNASITLPASTNVRDVSVYGTTDGFAGRARQGVSALIGSSIEYSLSRRWALALDLFHIRNARLRVEGIDKAGLPLNRTLPGTTQFAVAPGIEYSWTSNLGVLFAARYIPASNAGSASWSPAIAVNMVF